MTFVKGLRFPLHVVPVNTISGWKTIIAAVLEVSKLISKLLGIGSMPLQDVINFHKTSVCQFNLSTYYPTQL